MYYIWVQSLEVITHYILEGREQLATYFSKSMSSSPINWACSATVLRMVREVLGYYQDVWKVVWKRSARQVKVVNFQIWALTSARQHNGLQMTEEIQAQINGMDETDVIPKLRPGGNYWKRHGGTNGYQN